MGKETILLIAVLVVGLSRSLLFAEKMKSFLTCCLLTEERQQWKFLSEKAFCYKYPCKDGNSSCRISLLEHFSEITHCQIAECFGLQPCELPDSPFKCTWKFTMKPSEFARIDCTYFHLNTRKGDCGIGACTKAEDLEKTRDYLKIKGPVLKADKCTKEEFLTKRRCKECKKGKIPSVCLNSQGSAVDDRTRIFCGRAKDGFTVNLANKKEKKATNVAITLFSKAILPEERLKFSCTFTNHNRLTKKVQSIIEELTLRGRNELFLIIPEAKDLQHEIDLLMEKKECSRYMFLNCLFQNLLHLVCLPPCECETFGSLDGYSQLNTNKQPNCDSSSGTSAPVYSSNSPTAATTDDEHVTTAATTNPSSTQTVSISGADSVSAIPRTVSDQDDAAQTESKDEPKADMSGPTTAPTTWKESPATTTISTSEEEGQMKQRKGRKKERKPGKGKSRGKAE